MNDPLDDLLRQALSPPPDQAERIALRALNAAGSDLVRASGLRRLVPAGSLVAVLAAAAIFFSLQVGKPRPGSVVSIVNLDGMVIATSEEEERPLVLSGGGGQPSSGIILVRHGDSQ